MENFFGFHHKDPDNNVKGEIAKLLLSRGANVNTQTKYGITTPSCCYSKRICECR